jgi:hypothetical protein
MVTFDLLNFECLFCVSFSGAFGPSQPEFSLKLEDFIGVLGLPAHMVRRSLEVAPIFVWLLKQQLLLVCECVQRFSN